MRVVIVGVGGVGTRLASEVPMMLQHMRPGSEVVLVDGDVFEHKNVERQDFDHHNGVGVNKAAARAAEVSARYPGVTVSHVPEYLTPANVASVVSEGDVVLCAVDNHSSRLLLSKRVQQLADATLISGGSDFDTGNTQVHKRSGGVDLTPSIEYLHPEIGDPSHPAHSKSPAEMSCQELAAAGVPQLQVANFEVTSKMLTALWKEIAEEELTYSETYFDMRKGTARSVMRKVSAKKEVDHAEAAEPRDADLAGRSGSLGS